MKESRWYEVTTDKFGEKILNIYSSPNKYKAEFSSHTKTEDMQYYRNTFNLSKVWLDEEIEKSSILFGDV